MKKVAFLLLALSCCAFLGSCGFKDIDKRFFVVAMGIDYTGKTETPYLVTLRLAIPATKIGEGLAESQVEQLEAPSIAEAVRNLKSHVDKELDFGQCRVFLFGQSLIKHSMEEPLSWLGRRRDIQLISYLATAEPSANKVLKANPTTERIAGNAFFLTFGKEGTISPYTVTEYLFDSFRRFKEKGLDPYLPTIRFDGNSYVVEHLALLNKTKQQLMLNRRETLLFNLSANAFAKSGIAVNYEGKRLVLYISKVSKQVRITKDNVPTVHLRLKIQGMVEQTAVTLMNRNIPQVEKLLENHFNANTERLLAKIRDAGVDPYGFGLHYLAQYFGDEQDWKHWREVYPQVKFDVTSRVVIDSTGLIR
ncbi:Ger(x)C family spore germination protein [Paenibacillus glycinis]|uniref:Ger(X)C family spore germination protein n=1 Tax=Paenibacillus glycinis TaxID=2697035 RepID=A0ABW9XL08_9BACL|nr:Ger(x)C family spore germination protein [Paenibacillus glycinis]NBD23288.1 Ger(x)C family spore germination protein [Paenibacillus glycinis]